MKTFQYVTLDKDTFICMFESKFETMLQCSKYLMLWSEELHIMDKFRHLFPLFSKCDIIANGVQF